MATPPIVALIQEKVFALQDALSHATLYHYGALGLCFIVFVLLMTLMMMTRKRLWLSMIFLFLSLLTLFVAPFALFNFTNTLVRKTVFSAVKPHQLIYVDDIIVRGMITNKGRVKLSTCDITVSKSKNHPNEWVKWGYSFIPMSQETTHLSLPLEVGESLPFRATLSGRLGSNETLYIQGVCQ